MKKQKNRQGGFPLAGSLKEKTGHLLSMLKDMKKAAVAFSGGTDSTLLAAAAFRVLGSNAAAVTVSSPTLPEAELEDAKKLAALLGIRHVILSVSELDIADFVSNGKDRCYHCKKYRFEKLRLWVGENSFSWVLDGSNTDDLKDYRPGMKAISELEGVRSPLLEAGMTKQDVRSLSREWGLPSWNKPAAACLASRIAYGTPITREALLQVEKAEEIVRAYCPSDTQVRVRHHGFLARIEADPRIMQDLAAPETAAAIYRALSGLGFRFAALDLAGYRMGSMNDLPADRR